MSAARGHIKPARSKNNDLARSPHHLHYTNAPTLVSKALSMACVTIIVPALRVSYEVDVTKDMLVRDLKAELEVLTGLPIGANSNFHQSLEFRHIHAFD